MFAIYCAEDTKLSIWFAECHPDVHNPTGNTHHRIRGKPMQQEPRSTAPDAGLTWILVLFVYILSVAISAMWWPSLPN